MSEKYYVVSESELEGLLAAAYADGVDGSTNVAETHLDACRAREVPAWATHFAAPTDGSTELADEERGFRFKEIKYD